MKVVFLCGGVGKRMFPLSGDKPLLKFLGKTLLEHQIEKALASGLNQLVLVGNQSNIDKLGEIAGKFPQAHIALAVQKQPSGMAGAVQSAKPLVEEEMLVVNPGDIFDQSAYTAMLQAGRTSSAATYMLGVRVKQYLPGGYLMVNEEKEILGIVEKPSRNREPSNLMNLVVHLHTQAGALGQYLAEAKGRGSDAYELALNEMIHQGHKLRLVEYDGYWTIIKYPWHVLTAMEYFLKQSPIRIAPSAVISAKATVEGEVILDQNVRIMENAVVRGPCYIGQNSVIGNNVLIRGGVHIGADCVAGFSTEIKHSYIGDRCWFHTNYIGDSVIADGCSFGAGTVTANRRFDEEVVTVMSHGHPLDTTLNRLGAIIGADSKIGVNVSLMPGVRVGPKARVGPHLMLKRDLGPNQTIIAGGAKAKITKMKK